jgi:hypothetical protein
VSYIRKHTKLIGVAASCVALGAAAGAVSNAVAADGQSATSRQGSANPNDAHHPRGGRVALWRVALRRSVHGDLTVATRSGFATVTFDRGTVQSVSGDRLTLAEGTRTATYRTITLMIPPGAKVREAGKPASLAELRAGQRVLVLQAPKGTWVIARSISG